MSKRPPALHRRSLFPRPPHSPLLVVVSAAEAVFLPPVHAQQARPNILIFVADDLGWAYIGAYDRCIRDDHADRITGVWLTERHDYAPPGQPLRNLSGTWIRKQKGLGRDCRRRDDVRP